MIRKGEKKNKNFMIVKYDMIQTSALRVRMTRL